MKLIVIAATILMLVSGAGLAQAPADKPAAAPAGGETKPASQREITVVQGPGQSTVKEDARHCLEHGTNTDIIKCAEPYLPLRLKK